ncbi:MAG: rod-binding protein [Alphaproteobacteria bacterium]|nr:rod-binding protein [Alphaproteobacteria bacterium]
MTNISPDTSIAVMQASQGQRDNVASFIKNASRSKDMERIDEVAKDFEAMFVTEMMKPMFEGIKPDPMFGGGKTEEVFHGILLQEYGKLMAETGQLGIADNIKAELIRMQESAIDVSANDQTQSGGINNAQ